MSQRQIATHLVNSDKRDGGDTQPGSDGQGEAVARWGRLGVSVEQGQGCQSMAFKVKPDVVFSAHCLKVAWINVLKKKRLQDPNPKDQVEN